MESRIRDDMSQKDHQTGAACASCMTRRSFVEKTAALAAVAAFFAACSGEGSITDPTVPTQIKVSSFPGLATLNQLVLIDAQRAAKRTGTSTFAAYSRACTHEGTQVELSGTGFFCGNHGATYDNNGHVTLGPATRNLTVLSTSYDAATDMLTIG